MGGGSEFSCEYADGKGPRIAPERPSWVPSGGGRKRCLPPSHKFTSKCHKLWSLMTKGLGSMGSSWLGRDS